MDSYDDSSTGKEKRSKHKSSKSDERSKRALQRVKEESAKFTLNDRRALAKAKAGSPAKKRPRSESSSSDESSGSSLLSSHVNPKGKSKKQKGGVRTIWINGLSSDIDESVIKATFGRYGSIKSIKMYRGSCSLEYKDPTAALNALKERDNTNFHGSTIRVSDRPPLPPTPVTAPTTKGKEQKPTRQPPPEEKELWIGGLGPHYNEAYIQGMLEVFGDVVSLEVHNGWCYAKFKYPDDAAAALKELQSGTLLHGSNIQAKYKKDVNPAKIEAEYPSSWEKPAEPSKSKAEPILKKRAARSESAESVASISPSREQRKAAKANKVEQPTVDWRSHPAAAMGMGYYYPPYPDPAAWEAMMARGGPYPPGPYPMPYPPYPMPRPGENPYQKTSPRRSRSRDRKDDRDRDRDRDREREREKDKDKEKERGRSRSRSKSRDRDRDRKDDRSRSKDRSPKRKERSRSHERSRKDRSRSRDRRSRSRSRDRSRKRSRSPKRSRSRSRSRPKKELDRNFRKDWYADDANVKRGMDEEAIKAGRELWVGGLDPESDDVEPVRTLFEKHGVVTAISLRKAWCFLTYSDPESAKEAIDQLDGQKAFGRPLRVTLRTLPPGARDRGGSPKRGNSPN